MPLVPPGKPFCLYREMPGGWRPRQLCCGAQPVLPHLLPLTRTGLCADSVLGQQGQVGTRTAGQRGPEAPSNCELTTGHNLDSTTCQDQQDPVMGGREEVPPLCFPSHTVMGGQGEAPPLCFPSLTVMGGRGEAPPLCFPSHTVMGGRGEAPPLCFPSLGVTRRRQPFCKPLSLKQEDAH